MTQLHSIVHGGDQNWSGGGSGVLLHNKAIYCIVRVTFTVGYCRLTLSKKKFNEKCTQTHQQPRGRGDD